MYSQTSIIKFNNLFEFQKKYNLKLDRSNEKTNNLDVTLPIKSITHWAWVHFTILSWEFGRLDGFFPLNLSPL